MKSKSPNLFMPFWGNDFFESISGYNSDVGLGYLRAVWHYWHKTECNGLKNDDDYLRRVCCFDKISGRKRAQSYLIINIILSLLMNYGSKNRF